MTSEVRVRLGGVLLVDGSGRVLMQHRDQWAPIDPQRWCMPGGHLHDGESPEIGARRELWEETGLTTGAVELFWHDTLPGHYPGTVAEWNVYCAPTAARQSDVVLGEGQAMVFLTPEETRARDLTASAEAVVPQFLASTWYQRLTARAASWVAAER